MLLVFGLAAALATTVDGKVTAPGGPVVDAAIRTIGVDGIPSAPIAYTDRKGRFSAEVPEGHEVFATRPFRLPFGNRVVLSSEPVPAEDAGRLRMTEADTGAGPGRLQGRVEGEVKGQVKTVRKRYSDIREACSAVLDATDRAAAREAGTEHAAALMIAQGGGFEGCVDQRFFRAEEVEVSERYTFHVDAAGGAVDQRLWNGYASLSFARWTSENALPGRAQRAAGVATQRLGGIIGTRSHTGEGSSARPLLAEAYEIEAESAMLLGDNGAAVSKFHQALRVYRQLGDVRGMGRAEIGIARAESRRGRVDKTVEHAQEALHLDLAPGQRVWVWRTQAEVGAPDAITYAQRAAEAYAELGNTSGQRRMQFVEALRHIDAGDLDAASALLDALPTEEGDPLHGMAGRVAAALEEARNPPEPEVEDEPAEPGDEVVDDPQIEP